MIKREDELLEEILKGDIPRHIAIIMDGNGRWARQRNLPRTMGHKKGMERVIEIVESSIKVGLESLTLFAFSTENWKRPEKEVSALMNLLVVFIDNELKRLIRNGVKLNIMGDLSKIPKKPQESVIKAVEKTKNNNKMTLNIALNYGGQNEIVYAVKGLLKDAKKGIIDIDDIDEEKFYDYLYTKGQANPDLLIRPSGELRISNFMLYQIAYAEFYFSDILWPDFEEKEYYQAILNYQKRNRRFGGI